MSASLNLAKDHTHHLIALSKSLLTDVMQALEKITTINKTVHILSMNARVEAARAGDAGRGFAVVAAELTRLSSATDQTTQQVEESSRRTGTELQAVASRLAIEATDARHCDLAHHAMDLVDRNLYERSCDVRWWATDSAVVQCAASPADEALRQHASRRLGQILDSYTVYADLVLVAMDGRVVANGRPRQWPSSVGSAVGTAPWFQSALATSDGTQFGFQSVHDCDLVGGQRALVYSCTVREGGAVSARPLGVLGIVFRWDALGPAVLDALPLSAQEWSATRACIVDAEGTVLADKDVSLIGRRLHFDGMDRLLRDKRGAASARMDGRTVRVCHAASPGFETYATGWHCLLMREE